MHRLGWFSAELGAQGPSKHASGSRWQIPKSKKKNHASITTRSLRSASAAAGVRRRRGRGPRRLNGTRSRTGHLRPPLRTLSGRKPA